MKKRLLLLVFIFGIYACKKEPFTQAPIKNFDYDKAESLIYKNNDSAFYYFNKVATSSRDSLQVAMAYNYMAVIQAEAGDYFGGQESLLTSLKFLDENDPKDFACLSSDYNELGVSNFNLKKYGQALAYYDLSTKFSKNDAFKLMICNNKALAYQKSGDYNKAIDIYNQIIPPNNKNQKEYARVLSNITRTKWLQNPNYNAAPDFLKALIIREKENDEWGKNASYAHLADYYAKKKPDAASAYASRMYRISVKLASPDDQLEALQKLIKLSPPEETKRYFEIYQNLNDSLQTARNAAKNQFALIRYESEKNKADNLKLQKDNTEKEYRIAKQEIILFIVLLILVAGSIIAVLWYKKRKQKIELKAQNAIRENQLKTSKRVHDVVANGLYRVMAEIENRIDIDRDNVLDKIENLYEKSRDISYEKPEHTGQDFHDKISALLKSFATENTKILIAGNNEDLWEKVNQNIRYEIEHIIQELMVNMKKHSRAGNVGLRFEELGDQINIYYTDDGVGIAADVSHNNGLRNTGNRIDTINGAITFDTKLEKGLKIQISFPTS